MGWPNLWQRFFIVGTRWVIGLSCCALSVGGYAEDGADEFGDLPVVLSASRLRQPLIEAPSAVTVIDRQMIEASGARHIADLMRYVPGAVVGYNDGNRPVVALQGMSGTYASGVQVLVDGVSVYTPLWGGMQWEELPLALDDLERIEVIRGPNAAVFGPNSFAGVINIITRHPAADSDWKLSSNVGNRGVADLSLTHSSVLGNGTKYRATFGQRASDGFDTRPDTQRQYFGNFRSEYQVDSINAVQMAMYFANNKKDNGDYTSTGSNQVPHPNFSNRFDFQLRWSRALSSDEEWWVQYYHQDSQTSDSVNVNFKESSLWRALVNKYGAGLNTLFPSPIPYTVDSGYQTQRDGVEFQHTMRLHQDIRLVYGVETRRDVASSSTYLGNDSQSSVLTRIYGNVEWKIGTQWTLHVANMIEKNTLADTGVSPKVALTWQPIANHVLRLGVSSALRTPSISEKRANVGYVLPAQLYPYTSGITEVRVRTNGLANNEKVKSEEVGYSFNVPEWNLMGDMRWYQEFYRDLMGKDDSGSFVNKDKANAYGGDFTLKWLPSDSTVFRLALGKLKIVSNTSPSSFNASAPDNTVSFLWDQKLDSKWRLSANYQRVGSMHWTDAGNNNQNPVIPAIDYLTLRFGKDLGVSGFSESELALVIQNALGNHRDYWAGMVANGQKETIAPRISFLQFVGRF